MRSRTGALTIALIAVSTATAAVAQQPPSPRDAIQRACAAAGGTAAFASLPIIAVEIRRDETTSDGQTSKSTQRAYVAPPGPTPGRFEHIEAQVIAGDDGSGGWATVGGTPDPRPATSYMVKRIMSTTLFPLLLPFSLNWEGVTVTNVTAGEVDGTRTWRLKLVFPKSFFASPQIANEWTVDLDRSTFKVVRAESPFTDLGNDMVADGMRFSWMNPVQVQGVILPSVQQVVGLDRAGVERTHSRIDAVRYVVLPASESVKLFPNPIPAEKRPQMPAPGRPGAQTPKP